jgi:hypothetical protein
MRSAVSMKTIDLLSLAVIKEGAKYANKMSPMPTLSTTIFQLLGRSVG